MLAAVIVRPGGPDVLEVRNVPVPVPQASEVRVRVHASALNRADILQRRGKYPAPAGVPADIPGMEFAGEVEAMGSSAQLWKLGQRVMGLVGGGAHAEFVVVHERTLAEIPSSFTWAQAAAIPEAFITAHDALWVQARLRPSERVLIHAVGSGVGLAALQLVRAMNAVPFGTSRTADKLERARQFGLESGFVVPDAPTADNGQRWGASGGFDVVLDLAGGAYTNASLHALALRGRMMLVGTMAGAKTEIDLGLALGRRAQMIGTVLRARPLEEKIAVTRAFAKEVVPLLTNAKTKAPPATAGGSDRTLRPVIDSEFSLQEIRQAHERMESNETFGKIVLKMD